MTLDEYFHKKEREEDMQIRNVEYSRTFRIREFESEKILVGAELDPTDDFGTCLMDLQARVIQAHETMKDMLEPRRSNSYRKSRMPLTRKSFLIIPTGKERSVQTVAIRKDLLPRDGRSSMRIESIQRLTSARLP